MLIHVVQIRPRVQVPTETFLRFSRDPTYFEEITLASLDLTAQRTKQPIDMFHFWFLERKRPDPGSGKLARNSVNMKKKKYTEFS